MDTRFRGSVSLSLLRYGKIKAFDVFKCSEIHTVLDENYRRSVIFERNSK